MTLLACKADDVPHFRLGNALFSSLLTSVRNPVHALVDVEPFDPAVLHKVVNSSTRRVCGEGNRTVHIEVGVPEAGRHRNVSVRHVLEYDFCPVYCAHGIAVLGHPSYFLRHALCANRYRHSSMPIGVCNEVVATFMRFGYNGVSNDHASGSHRVHNQKTPGLPSQREPGAWSPIRMYENDLDRLKMQGGTIAVQTPSRASAPDQLRTLVGADTLRVTATDQSTRRAGGGRRVDV